MPNTTAPADGGAMPAEGRKSRRAILGAMASIPTLAILPAVARAPASVDPVYAAIQRHRDAEQVFSATLNGSDRVYARTHGREVTDADEQTTEAANDVERAAMDDLLNTPPTTLAGMRAAIEYIIEFEGNYPSELSNDMLRALLDSPLLGEATHV